MIRPLANLHEQLRRLPGIGSKTAMRLAYHIIDMSEEDVRRLAQSNGENHNSWEVLQKYLRMKNDPEVYSDTTNVRCGRFEDHRQTIGFVNKVLSRYDYYCGLTEI